MEKNSFVRGNVEMIVLILLKDNDYYGLQLINEIREISNGIIDLSVGTLYPALYKMISAGYISDYKQIVGKRKEIIYYHIEHKGVKRLDKLLNEYMELNEIIKNLI